MYSSNTQRITQIDRNAAMVSLAAGEISGASKLTELYDAVCEVVVGVGGYSLAWIGLAEYNLEQSVFPVAKCGYSSGYVETATVTWSEHESGLGPVGTAIREGTMQVCNDIKGAPSVRLWRTRALRRGFLSNIALPLTGEKGTFGALSVYAMEEDAFGPEEIGAFTRLAGLLSERVCAMRREATATLVRFGYTESSMT